MKCKLIKEKIDLLIFEENELLSTEISSHIENCDTCKSYFTESKQALKIMGQIQTEPQLHDPDHLTKSILNQIEEIEQVPGTNNKNQKIYWIIRRSLAAASICLILVFGIEQYVLYKKVSKMEEYVSHLSIEYKNTNLNIELKNGNLYKILHYNLGFQPESINKLFANDIKSTNHPKLKARLIRSRISAMAVNKRDNHRINNFIQKISIRSIDNTN